MLSWSRYVSGSPCGAPSEVDAHPPISPCLSARSAGSSPTARRAFLYSRLPLLLHCRWPQAPHAQCLAQCQTWRSCIYYLFSSNLKQRQEMERSTPICLPRLVACGQSWQGGGWWCMHGGGWCVEDGGGLVVVCGRCEDDDDSGVCIAVGWWTTHIALMPCA